MLSERWEQRIPEPLAPLARTAYQVATGRQWRRVVEIRQRLAARSLTDFVRVDLYDLGDRVVFGELTNYPGRAIPRFEPAALDLELGRHWRIEGYGR